jgi:hypothetical protein
MKALVAFILVAVAIPALAKAPKKVEAKPAKVSTAVVDPSKNNVEQSVLTITGPAADALFDKMGDELMQSSDVESDKGRPVWKEGRSVYCGKFIGGKVQTETMCAIVIKNKTGELVDLYAE